MSSDPVARKPGQFAQERFKKRHRAWLRRVQWILVGAALGELAVAVALGAVLQPDHIGFYWGLGLGIALTMLLALGDSPPEHIDRWRRGADGEKDTAKQLRGLTRRGWVLINDIDTGRGNIDHVLIGPPGVFLLESKSLAGVLSVRAGMLTVRWREDPDDGWENSTFAPRARAAAAQLAAVLREAGMYGLWVQPVIVLWATFEQPPTESGRVAWIQGKQLAGALARRPASLLPETIERAATIVSSLNSEMFCGLQAERMPARGEDPSGCPPAAERL